MLRLKVLRSVMGLKALDFNQFLLQRPLARTERGPGPCLYTAVQVYQDFTIIKVLAFGNNRITMATESNHDQASRLWLNIISGVGRTGTFLALYKLWLEYNNPACKKYKRNIPFLTIIVVGDDWYKQRFAILPTVVALRRQRFKMVQKPVGFQIINWF